MWSLLGRHLMVLRIYLDGRVVVPTSDGTNKDVNIEDISRMNYEPSRIVIYDDI
jgi:hypothetical protein